MEIEKFKKKNFDYDELTDSLLITRKKEGEKVQGSAEIGNLTIDFTKDGRIVSVEFMNISKFLKIISINPEILKKLTEVNLIVQEQRGAVSIFAILRTPQTKQAIPIATIPLRKPLTSSS